MSALLTRRRVLVGGAATSAATLVGGGWLAMAGSPPVRRRLHSLGLLDGPDHEIPRGDSAADVVYGTLDSPDGRTRAWGLWTPSDGEVTLCLVCLHGKGGDERFAFDSLGVHRFVADAGLPWAVATLDGGRDYWHPRDGSDAQAAVTAGLLPVLAARLGPDVRHAGLGWSMGGYGVLLLAERSPDAFVAVAAASPAVWTSFGDASPGAFDDADDFRAHDVLADANTSLDGLPVRIDCGADDFFAGTSRRLLDAVPDADGGIHPGFHDKPTWRSFLPAQLHWLKVTTA